MQPIELKVVIDGQPERARRGRRGRAVRLGWQCQFRKSAPSAPADVSSVCSPSDAWCRRWCCRVHDRRFGFVSRAERGSWHPNGDHELPKGIDHIVTLIPEGPAGSTTCSACSVAPGLRAQSRNPRPQAAASTGWNETGLPGQHLDPPCRWLRPRVDRFPEPPRPCAHSGHRAAHDISPRWWRTRAQVVWPWRSVPYGPVEQDVRGELTNEVNVRHGTWACGAEERQARRKNIQRHAVSEKFSAAARRYRVSSVV
jgi:hypothetical protein